MTAPTEAEIREAIEGDFRGWDDLASAINALGNMVDTLWDTDEFRKSELDALDAIGSAEKTEMLAYIKVNMSEFLIRDALRFAREHPDAPRKPQLIPA
jgi:hypothetical protein